MVEEKSGGRLKITIFPGSTLGKAVDHYDMVKDGIADMGFTTPGYTPGRFPLIAATELPLLFKSSRGGSLAVMSIFDKYFKTEFKDVKVLWFWVHPPGPLPPRQEAGEGARGPRPVSRSARPPPC